jgi:hypothetical protein
MEHAKESFHEARKAYVEAFENAKTHFGEAIEAVNRLQVVATRQSHEHLRQKQLAARRALDDWRQSTDDLYAALNVGNRG